MNGLLMLVAYMAALNPMRTRLGVPEHSDGMARMGPLASGAAIGLAPCSRWRLWLDRCWTL